MPEAKNASRAQEAERELTALSRLDDARLYEKYRTEADGRPDGRLHHPCPDHEGRLYPDQQGMGVTPEALQNGPSPRRTRFFMSDYSGCFSSSSSVSISYR